MHEPFNRVCDKTLVNVENYSLKCLETLHRMHVDIHSTARNAHLTRETLTFDVWTQLIECMKIHSWLCKIAQSDMWKYSVEYMKYSIERMKAHAQIYEENYLNTKLLIRIIGKFHQIYDATRSNGQRYIFGYLKHRLGCVNVINRMYENTFVVV